ncbi:MAG: hypothetical protein VXW65_12725 [Pseudomonadota bacterium]|nr:hypothetical protein [Pseudomonadota bacterium]
MIAVTTLAWAGALAGDDMHKNIDDIDSHLIVADWARSIVIKPFKLY